MTDVGRISRGKLKNRGGRGKGSQVLLYERAYHRFNGLSVPGQALAEGRGDPDSPAPSYAGTQGGGSAKPSATGHHAPRSKNPVEDLDRAWKAEKKRYTDSGEAARWRDPVTGAYDPNAPTPDWLLMKNEAARQKEARRKGDGDY